MKGRLTGDKLSWRRTKFKLVAYVSNLLGSNNVRFNLLGEGMKEVLGIAEPPYGLVVFRHRWSSRTGGLLAKNTE